MVQANEGFPTTQQYDRALDFYGMAAVPGLSNMQRQIEELEMENAIRDFLSAPQFTPADVLLDRDFAVSVDPEAFAGIMGEPSPTMDFDPADFADAMGPAPAFGGAPIGEAVGAANSQGFLECEFGHMNFEQGTFAPAFGLNDGVVNGVPAGAVLITSNRSVAEWGTVFADPVVATAILDRLLHHSHVLTIRGDSYRLRAKRRSGLIKAPTADDAAPVGPASLHAVIGGSSHQPQS